MTKLKRLGGHWVHFVLNARFNNRFHLLLLPSSPRLFSMRRGYMKFSTKLTEVFFRGWLPSPPSVCKRYGSPPCARRTRGLGYIAHLEGCLGCSPMACGGGWGAGNLLPPPPENFIWFLWRKTNNKGENKLPFGMAPAGVTALWLLQYTDEQSQGWTYVVNLLSQSVNERLHVEIPPQHIQFCVCKQFPLKRLIDTCKTVHQYIELCVTLTVTLNSRLSGWGLPSPPFSPQWPLSLWLVGAILTPVADQNQPLTITGCRSARCEHPSKLHLRPDVHT